VDSKKWQNSVNLKNKIKSSNEKSISEVHWNFPNMYVYIISKIIKLYDCCKFLFLRIHFTLKNLIFCMDFLINHMFRDIHKLVY
jgi:hypothetical protein